MIEQSDRIIDIERRMIEQIDKAKEKGWKIVCNCTFNPGNRTCCALGAQAANGIIEEYNFYSIARHSYQMDANEAEAFVHGFLPPTSRNSMNSSFKEDPFYILGVRLGDKYLPQFDNEYL